ncbi:MAG: hydroxymethylglutaryl-CoA lyase [Hyphomicrobiales bacterium]|nr:hydroxymethylglutaryl-CoA lyase [Hyphomicrobiales bacterium]
MQSFNDGACSKFEYGTASDLSVDAQLTTKREETVSRADFPKFIHIKEEGPREGFQFEKGHIPTARKIELIDALSRTGLKAIQIVSFVNPKAVPGQADAEAVVAGITPQPGVKYLGLWLNERGYERALATGRLDANGGLQHTTSAPFLKRNQNRTIDEQTERQHIWCEMYKRAGAGLDRATIMGAFGCNFQGDVPIKDVVDLAKRLVTIAIEHGLRVPRIQLADTMAWATPLGIKRVVGAIQDQLPEYDIALHLHDTRGMGIANAYAGLEMGISHFDGSVAGLGGCPFAGHTGAAGNVCTEDLVFMLHEMGIETGIDLEALIDCANLAEDIVGHPLPGSIMKGRSLKRLRERVGQPA